MTLKLNIFESMRKIGRTLHSDSSSKAYRVIMFLLGVVYFLLNWSFMQVVISEQSTEAYRSILLRSLVDVTTLILILHFLIRPFLRNVVIRHQFSTGSIGRMCLYIFVISVFSFTLNYTIGKFEIFKITDVHQIQIKNDSGEIGASIPESIIWIVGITESFLLFLGWSTVYLFWHHHKQRRKLQSEMNYIQIQQLINQLNPHFLFNTLNSIRALIFEDKDKAADTITRLSELLRTHMQSNLKPDICLKDEWVICEHYMEIEQIRFDERLNFTIDIDDSVLGQKVPTLSLLTLLENAIKHGIMPSSIKGYITVTAQQESPELWQLKVENSVYSNTKSGTRVGLENIQKRFNLMFGVRGKFETKKSANKYTTVMEMPYV